VRNRRRQRVGMVLGAGGVLGAAWTAGALAALQGRLDYPLEEVDLLVGTSAGSVLATVLRCGFGTGDLVAHQRQETACCLGKLGPPNLGCPAMPPWPSPGLGSPRLLLRALRAPLRIRPGVVASACFPPGRADHAALRALVRGLVADDRLRTAPEPMTTGAPVPMPSRRPQADGDRWREWEGRGRTWLVAVDYDSGRRVPFGRRGSPRVSLPDAVVASCSVPGWFRPAVIGSRRYVDGGVYSGTNADLLASARLDRVYILAPAASLAAGRPRHLGELAERLVRRTMTGALRREVATLQASGAQVTVLTPGPEDLAVMGGNLMNGRRRLATFETSLRTSAAALAAPPACP
jgi:NTE family protein